MGEVFVKLLNMSITASWLILAVLCVRFLFRRIPKWVNCLLWGIVAIRLIFPFSIESELSLQPSAEPIKSSAIVQGEVVPYVPSIDSNLEILENTVNPILAETFAYQESDSVAPLQVFTGIAGSVWLCGMVALFIFALVSMIKLRLSVREAVQYRENIYICDVVKSPFILGIIKPRIYLSSALNKDEIDFIIAHEKAHLRRKDHFWKPLGYLLLCIYWFNPLCWIAYIMLCKDIELACDERVIKNMSFGDKKEYSRVLLSCAAQRRLVLVCPLAFGEVGVKERIKSVLNYKKPAFWIIMIAIVVCIIVAICFLTNPSREYRIRVTIPAGSTEEIIYQEDFFYSDEEISPTGNQIIISLGVGMGDTEVVLKPIEVKEENAYEPTYITSGMPVKMDVEKGAWFKIGVNMQNPTTEDIDVYVSVKNVEVRIKSVIDEEQESHKNEHMSKQEQALETESQSEENTISSEDLVNQIIDHFYYEREGFEEAQLTYVVIEDEDFPYYNDGPWETDAQRDALAQHALKELYDVTGFQVEECVYTTDGRSRFIFGKSAEYIDKSIAFYTRDYGWMLAGENVPYMGFVNARTVHYSDIQQLVSPYHDPEWQGNGAIPAWFLTHSGIYGGEKLTGFDAVNLDDTVFTHINMQFDGGYYRVVTNDGIESLAEIAGPYYTNDSENQRESNVPDKDYQSIEDEVYRNLIREMMETNVFPATEGTQCSGMPYENSYSIIDIDDDGKEELIINFGNASCMAGMVLYVYDYDRTTKEAYIQYSGFPDITVYDSGYIKEAASHNHGRSSMYDFWPYRLLQYNATTDKYEDVAEIDAWQQSFYKGSDLDPDFPKEKDLDGDGVVYYSWDEGYYEPSMIMDNTEYEKWCEKYNTGNVKKISWYPIISEEEYNKMFPSTAVG